MVIQEWIEIKQFCQHFRFIANGHGEQSTTFDHSLLRNFLFFFPARYFNSMNSSVHSVIHLFVWPLLIKPNKFYSLHAHRLQKCNCPSNIQHLPMLLSTIHITSFYVRCALCVYVCLIFRCDWGNLMNIEVVVEQSRKRCFISQKCHVMVCSFVRFMESMAIN